MDLATFTPTSNAQRHAGLRGAWLLSLTSDNTRRAYARDLDSYFSFLDSDAVDTLTAERKHIDLWRETLDGAPSSVARRLSAVSSFYSYAEDERAVPGNPAKRTKRPKVDADHSATRGLTKAEAQAFLNAAREDGPRSLALASILLMTGARISEVLGATTNDLQHDTGHRVLVVRRKGGKLAKLVLPAPTLAALSHYMGASAAEGTEVATSITTGTAPLFTTSTGKRWAASEAFRTVARLAREAGIEGRVSPHSMRHTHATLALDAGATLHDLQDSMGHADPRTTRRYDRARGRLEKSSAYTVAGLLS